MIRHQAYCILMVLVLCASGASAVQTGSVPDSLNSGFYEAHSWPDSNCTLCHQSSSPGPDSAQLIDSDQTQLCLSCHQGRATILGNHPSGIANGLLLNHPVKFTPLDFNPLKMNHNIVKREESYYISGQTGDVQLFGNSRESALVECSSCHDPHGKLGLPDLRRTELAEEQFCVICHIHIRASRDPLEK